MTEGGSDFNRGQILLGLDTRRFRRLSLVRRQTSAPLLSPLTLQRQGCCWDTQFTRPSHMADQRGG